MTDGSERSKSDGIASGRRPMRSRNFGDNPMGPNPYESPAGVDDLPDKRPLICPFFRAGFLFGLTVGWLIGLLSCLIAMSISDRFRELGY